MNDTDCTGATITTVVLVFLTWFFNSIIVIRFVDLTTYIIVGCVFSGVFICMGLLCCIFSPPPTQWVPANDSKEEAFEV